MEYPKINTLWKREGCGTFDEAQNRYVSDLQHKPRKSQIIEGLYACDEFAAIDRWTVTEKVDGTNVRVLFNRTTNDDLNSSSDYRQECRLEFRGRTDMAQFPTFLFTYLQKTFTLEAMQAAFPLADSVILFGEGYGPKIQIGDYYRKDVSFMLFDVWIDGWWLDRTRVIEVAEKLLIDWVPRLACKGEDEPDFDIWTKQEIVDFVKSKPESQFSSEKHLMEGIVARSEPLMMYRKKRILCEDPLVYADYHDPIMFKLKVKDYQ